MRARADDEEAVERELLGLDIVQRNRQRNDCGVDLACSEALEQRRRLLLTHINFPAYPPSSASFSLVYGIGTVRTPAQVRRGIMAARSYLRLKRYWYSAR